MESHSLSKLTWQVANNALLIKGPLTRETLLPLYDEKKAFFSIEVIDVTDVSHVDSAGLALLTQLCFINPSQKKILKGASENLASLIQAYRLPL